MTPAPRAMPGFPRAEDGPVFGAPWEARAFALAVQLSEQGVFTWEEWVAALSAEIAEAEAQGYEPSRDYYRCWLHALEHLLASKGLLTAEGLAGSITETLRTWPHPPHGTWPDPVAISPAWSHD